MIVPVTYAAASEHSHTAASAISPTSPQRLAGMRAKWAALVEAHAQVGNLYVNRNQIGAVVESQPFGGEGLSGTGPKAGGPNYVARFATERVVCIDTTAAGGNASLMAGG